MDNDTIINTAEQVADRLEVAIRANPGSDRAFPAEDQVALARFCVRLIAGAFCNLNDLADAARAYTTRHTL